MSRRRKRSPPEAARSVLFRSLCDMGMREQAQRLMVARHWATVVGPSIAARTRPGALQRGVLHIQVANATWRNELTFLRASLIAKLNASLGHAWVKELKIARGSLVAEPPPPPPRPCLRPQAEDLAAAREVADAAGIAHAEVHAAFTHLMALDRRSRRPR